MTRTDWIPTLLASALLASALAGCPQEPRSVTVDGVAVGQPGGRALSPMAPDPSSGVVAPLRVSLDEQGLVTRVRGSRLEIDGREVAAPGDRLSDVSRRLRGGSRWRELEVRFEERGGRVQAVVLSRI